MGRHTYSGFYTPTFIVDWNQVERNYGGQILWERVDSSYRAGAVKVAVSGATAQGATSVPVAALKGEIPSGRTVAFGGAKYATLTAPAKIGDTTLTVQALPVALTNTDVGYSGGGPKFLPAGTVLCKAANSNKYIPRKLKANGDGDASVILFTVAQDKDAWDQNGGAGYTGYGLLVGGNVWENLLPDADPATGLIPAAYKTELAANTRGFVYEKSFDSRAA